MALHGIQHWVALIIGKNDCTNKLGNSSALPHIVCLVANIANLICTIKRCLYNNIDVIQDHSSIHAIAACILVHYSMAIRTYVATWLCHCMIRIISTSILFSRLLCNHVSHADFTFSLYIYTTIMCILLIQVDLRGSPVPIVTFVIRMLADYCTLRNSQGTKF